jgi:multidrug transporter EmrE-like cation transporter
LRPIVVALFLLIAIGLGAVGQVSLKHGMSKQPLGVPGAGLAAKVLRAVFTPYVLLGFTCYAVSSMFWLVVISPGGWNLSYAYPMIAVGYVAVVLLSRLFFHEAVTPLQWLGILLMCSGLAITAGFGAARGAAP